MSTTASASGLKTRDDTTASQFGAEASQGFDEIPGDGTTGAHQSMVADSLARRIESPPPLRKMPVGQYAPEDPELRLLQCKAICDRAGRSFSSACDSSSSETSESHMFAVIDAIEELWKFSDLRGRPFQDLVGLLDAALRDTMISTFDNCQRDVVRSAFGDLKRSFITDEDLDRIRGKFAETGIDILRPLRKPKKGKTIRIVVGDDD